MVLVIQRRKKMETNSFYLQRLMNMQEKQHLSSLQEAAEQVILFSTEALTDVEFVSFCEEFLKGE